MGPGKVSVVGYKHSEAEWKGFLKWCKARGTKISSDALQAFRLERPGRQQVDEAPRERKSKDA